MPFSIKYILIERFEFFLLTYLFPGNILHQTEFKIFMFKQAQES